MNEIRKQVNQARRRLALNQFGKYLIWSTFLGLIVALLGLAIPKLWYLDFLAAPGKLQTWNYSWIVGASIVAVLIAGIMTFRQLQSQLNVATEIDRRFKLKERLSSALSLQGDELNTPAGQALLQDATDRAQSIDVRDQFALQPSPMALLPLIPIVLMAGLHFVPNAQKKMIAATEEQINKQDIKLIIEEAKKKREQTRNQDTKGLKDAKPEVQALEKKFDELLDDQNADKKNSLVKLNDIQKQIEDRKKSLGDAKELKENLNRLNKAAQGPAKELADALGKGDIPQAQKAIRDLAKKLREGKLNDMEAKKLAKDLESMAKELQKIAEKKQQEKQDLEQQLQKARESGDLDKAAQLQEKIDQLEQQIQQQEKMQQMAKKLQECANCMKQGAQSSGKKQNENGQPRPGGDSNQQAQAQKEAAESLEDIANQLEEMQSEMEELEDLEDLEKLAEGCKNCMNGGCKNGGEPKWQDFGGGEGRGGGKRALEKNDTSGFKSKVEGQLQKGATVITGTADGDNISGRSVAQARKLVDEAMSRESDPLEDQVLPKSQRDHAQQYFESLRKNQ